MANSGDDEMCYTLIAGDVYIAVTPLTSAQVRRSQISLPLLVRYSVRPIGLLVADCACLIRSASKASSFFTGRYKQ